LIVADVILGPGHFTGLMHSLSPSTKGQEN